MLVGRSGMVAVDTCSTERRTRAFAAAMRAVSPGPVHTLINTHSHPDHVRHVGSPAHTTNDSVIWVPERGERRRAGCAHRYPGRVPRHGHLQRRPPTDLPGLNFPRSASAFGIALTVTVLSARTGHVVAAGGAAVPAQIELVLDSGEPAVDTGSQWYPSVVRR